MSKRVFEPLCVQIKSARLVQQEVEPPKMQKIPPAPGFAPGSLAIAYTVIGVQRVDYYSIRAFVCFNRSTTKSLVLLVGIGTVVTGYILLKKRGGYRQ
ncbi:uncharacterized protein FOBCDRAFT_225599 [Fusarium oxysporum Fo47]|uniref:uncharacterized protein n=1 Tax=Fusarium oxysporum Fo47 TaxID=660027 RepID=UPI0027AD6A4E|nr:uncharacterized protein FOBCDRAFT_225599 [Fusarium oxysporum Fo47]KAJ9420403.1 hypothetical protein QL093DRAFT_2329902 [Fusarium oxysporum]WJG35520.1 hypothetical protein FOBCDRAFT_225599 [Fusarium oxysporum Fo47]